MSNTRGKMAKVPTKNEPTTQARTPRKTQLMMQVTTTPTSSTSTSSQEDAIQAAVDEQLFRELNATIPPEFQDENNKTAATPGLSALEVAERRAQEVLNAKLAASTASSVEARNGGAKVTRAQKKGDVSNGEG